MITDTVRLSRRLIRAQLKKPFYILLSVSQPLMYLVFFGAMFSNMPGMSLDQQSYIYFLTPGMVVMAALFGSAYLSAGTLADADRALFDSIIISPVNRLSISMSYVFANLVAVMLQMLTIAVAGVLLGGYPAGGAGGLIALLLIGTLTGIAFGCVSNTAGFLVRKAQHVLSAMNFLVMPLMFISGMMLSIRNMPVWMQELARFNPVHWAVTGAQAAYMGSWSGAALASLSALLLFTVVMVGAMHLTFVRFLARR